MGYSRNLDFLKGIGAFAETDRDVGNTDHRHRPVAVQQGVVGGQDLGERAFFTDHVCDELEWLPRQRIVRAQRDFLVFRELLFEPAEVRE